MPEMYECEVKTRFKLPNGKEERRWVVKPVKSIPTSGAQPDIRCMHCHGAIRVHKSHVANGPADHVEHLSHQDSVGCRGGHYFDGTQRLSKEPVG